LNDPNVGAAIRARGGDAGSGAADGGVQHHAGTGSRRDARCSHAGRARRIGEGVGDPPSIVDMPVVDT
jgi:hypothetical protein